MQESIEQQHAGMRESLDTLQKFKHLTFASEEVPLILSDFLLQVLQHFKTEKVALSSVYESESDKAGYEAHYISVLEEIADIQFDLINNQGMLVSSVLPKMADWVDTHEKLHSHTRLTKV